MALVCAGGGITGAVYEIGCLRALEDLLDRSVLDLDLYVGVSGGAFVASLLAAGMSPQELYEDVTAPASRVGMTSAPFFRLGLADFLRRVVPGAPGADEGAADRAHRRRTEHVGPGALGLRAAAGGPPGELRDTGVPGPHPALAKDWAIASTNSLGSCTSWRSTSIAGRPWPSATRATATWPCPAPCRPRRPFPASIGPCASAAATTWTAASRRPPTSTSRSGAAPDLVVCINPIVPILNEDDRGPLGGHLSNKGVTYVLDQALRIMLHGRMQYGMERYETEHPEVDILLIEPTRDDMRMFGYNIMRYSARRVVAEDGYRSVVLAFRKNHAAYGRLLRRHEIGLRDPFTLPEVPPRHPFRSSVARTLSSSLDRLESKLGKTRGRI